MMNRRSDRPVTIISRLAEEGRGGPEDWRLAMEVSGDAFSCQIVIVTVLLACALADAGDVLVLVDVAGDGDPGFAGGGAVSGRVEPAVFHSGDQGEGEHGGTGAFRPSFVVVDQLPPHPVFPLIFEQRA